MQGGHERGKLILVIGGARSGKSAFAEELVKTLGKKVTYIATAQALDEEMEQRIKIHRERRPPVWDILEESHWVSKRLGDLDTDVVLVDCLTLLVSNLLLDNSFPKPGTDEMSTEKQRAVLEEIEVFARSARDCKAHVVVVANEVGQGLVPTYPLGRAYRDVAGWANQILAGVADEVYLVVAGIPVELKELGRKVRTKLREGEYCGG